MVKKITRFLFAALFVCAFTQQSFSQASGVKPELIMYRHNSSPGSSPLPILNGDILGTLKWNGLTAIGAVRTGAAIRSETKNVAPGIIAANMIFSTTNSGPLTDHIILTETGLVGIDIMNPQYNLDVHGNTHTSGRFYGRIHFDEFSTNNDPPNTYVDEAYFERKTRTVLGVPAVSGANNFGGILTLAPGGGAHNHQLFFGQDGIWNRREVFSAGNWSGAWEKLLSSADIKGTPNRIARFLPPDNPSSKLGDSQLFDDGANVGIGTVTPDAAFLLTVAGNTKITGSERVENTLTAAADLHVLTNSDVDGNANVDGNSTLGGTLVVNGNTNLKATVDVDGESNFDQRMKIGAANYASGYLLSVGGKAIAEEVRVALQSTWPDYVFAPGAPAPDIREWDCYIQENGHLPGVPSAQTVQAAGGFDLGENQRILLEKIEQLTLMVIQQQKEIDELKNRIQAEKH